MNFFDHAFSKKLQASFLDLDLTFCQRTQDLDLLLSMRSFSLSDFLKTYPIPSLNSLIFSLENQNIEKCLNFSLKTLEKTSPFYKNCDCEISLFLSNFEVFWKSSAIIFLMKFLLEEPEFNIDLLREKEQELQKTQLLERGWDSSPRLRKEKTLKDFTRKLTLKREELLDDETKYEGFLVDSSAENLSFLTVFIEIRALKIHMISKDFSLAILSLQCFSASISLRNEFMDFHAKIKNFGLKEMTNYPVTGQKFITEGGLEIISEKDENSIEISYVSYENNSKFIVNNIASKMKIEIKELTILWLQQPMMRIIEFLNEEITAVLTNDYKTPAPIKEDSRFLLFLLKKPRFSQIVINIVQGRIFLKAKPKDRESFLLGFDMVKIENFQEKNKERITKLQTSKRRESINGMKESAGLKCEFLWVECYSIGIYGGKFGFLKSNTEENIRFMSGNSKAITGGLLIEKVFMAEECGKIYQEEIGNLPVLFLRFFFYAAFFKLLFLRYFFYAAFFALLFLRYFFYATFFTLLFLRCFFYATFFTLLFL